MKILEKLHFVLYGALNKIFLFLELALFLRLIVKYLEGNPVTPVVSFVYRLTQPLVLPFNQIFPNIVWPKERPVDMTTLSAIVGYGFLFFVVTQILRLMIKD